MRADQKVQVFSIGEPKKGTPREKRRYLVKWAVDGRHRTRSFKTKEQADRLRSQLQQAVRGGDRFDVETGEPVRWAQTEETWWTWSRAWLGLKWPSLAGNSRRSMAESLVMVTPHLVRRRAPDPPAGMMRWLWSVGFVPTVELDDGDEVRWLDSWSVPLDQVTPGLLEAALTAATTRQDGKRTSAEVSRRRYAGVKSAFRAAVVRELIDSNPMDRVVWTRPRNSTAINIALLPSVRDVATIVDELADDDGYGHYAAFFAVIGFAGLRPSEAARLRVDDLDLPATGWGRARLSGALTSPGGLYTADGSVVEEKGLKQRAETDTRVVPLPPVLVGYLRRHVGQYEKAAGDRLFTNSLGNDLTKDNWGRPWRDQRARRWPDGHALAKTRPYDLRHTAATTMLRAGVSPPEVARRLGHSVDMLMRIYAGVFEDEERRANALLDQALADLDDAQ